MNALWLAVALTASPLEAFWARDLDRFAAAVTDARAQARPGTAQDFYEDLLRWTTCQPLEPLQEDAPRWTERALLRVELGRRARLGPQAVRSDTLWRALLTGEAFGASQAAPHPSEAWLRWPVEAERWPDEVTVVELPRCSPDWNAPAGATEALDEGLLERVSRLPGGGRHAERLRYHAAVRALRAGALEQAKATAAALTPEALGPLAPFGALLLHVLELRTDAAEARALADRPELVDARAWLTAVATYRALKDGPTGALAPGAGDDSPLGRWMRYAQAEALARRGDAEGAARAALDALEAPGQPAYSWSDAARARVLEALAAKPHATDTLAQLQRLGAEPRFSRHLRQWAALALARGNARTAQDVALELRVRGGSDRLHGLGLLAELAFRARDLRAFEAWWSELLSPEVAVGRAQRGERSTVVRHTAEQLVTLQGERGGGGLRVRLQQALRRAEPVLVRVHQRAVRGLVEALNARPKDGAPLALGTLQAQLQRPLVPPPPLELEWPEPYSLLALPVPGAEHRAWFPAPARLETADAT